MNLTISKTPLENGIAAAEKVSSLIMDAVNARGYFRMMVSTGQSQFEFFEALTGMDIPWEKAELFHLDEYVGLSAVHKASFCGYLAERFIAKAPGAKMNYISGEGDIAATIARISALIREKPVDIGVIGIGENTHIAFNDPPADFDCTDAFKLVTLDEACRRQQVREGWFPSISDVPEQAVSVTVKQILACKTIVSVVPHAAKAKAVKDTLDSGAITNLIPATALKSHPDWWLYLDEGSASLRRD
ncbi:MAG: 6-phosphogluconolactonase [Oscillospiraceae bacterium]|nr:6-phosphogluconolactonase [Oscillospiraceae bacterium]